MEDIKLKELLQSDLNKVNNDLEKNLNKPEQLELILEYKSMLNRIIELCQKRNRF